MKDGWYASHTDNYWLLAIQNNKVRMWGKRGEETLDLIEAYGNNHLKYAYAAFTNPDLYKDFHIWMYPLYPSKDMWEKELCIEV